MWRSPANNGVGGVIIASAIIAGVGMARGVGLALLSPLTQRRRNGDSDICRFREPAGGVVSWSRLLPQQQYLGVRIMVWYSNAVAVIAGEGGGGATGEGVSWAAELALFNFIII